MNNSEIRLYLHIYMYAENDLYTILLKSLKISFELLKGPFSQYANATLSGNFLMQIRTKKTALAFTIESKLNQSFTLHKLQIW